MFRVHAVGSCAGWPAEVVGVFVTEAEARRHAELSEWQLDVFALAVYDAYEDVSVPLRQTDTGLGSVPVLGDEIAFAALLDDADPPPATVFGAAAEGERREITALYATREEAERHVAEAVYTCVVVELAVHRSCGELTAAEVDRRGG